MKKILNRTVEIVDKLVPDTGKKQEIAHDLIKAELENPNQFVRLARPSIIYVGLFVILCEVFGVRLLIIKDVDAIEASNSILKYFLTTWGVLVSAYIGGRSFEKAKIKQFKK